MPVHWTISHPARLVMAVAKDEVSVADFEKYFAGVTAEGAMSYRKIFEITHAPTALTEESGGARLLGAGGVGGARRRPARRCGVSAPSGPVQTKENDMRVSEAMT